MFVIWVTEQTNERTNDPVWECLQFELCQRKTKSERRTNTSVRWFLRIMRFKPSYRRGRIPTIKIPPSVQFHLNKK